MILMSVGLSYQNNLQHIEHHKHDTELVYRTKIIHNTFNTTNMTPTSTVIL